ncbi:MAG: GNAT superfamily N-acetyltransferase [Candidatus Latescibacterota bacterium]
MEQPRIATLGEFAELMDFIDLVFRPGQVGKRILQRQYPHLYRENKEHIRRHLVLRDGGKIIGQLAIHPVLIRLEGLLLCAGGIGTVATHPERRGQGIMSRLLEAAKPIMCERGYDISILGGDRQRYGWFGWENAGTKTVFRLTERSVGRPSPAERRIELVRTPPLTPALCRRLKKENDRRKMGVVRLPREIESIFRRTSRDLWVARDGRRFAYLVLGGARHQARPYERIDEAGGDTDLVRSALRLIMTRYKLKSLHAIASPDPLDAQLYEPISSEWSQGHDMMVKILNARSLFEKLEPLVCEKIRRGGTVGSFSFIDGKGEQWGEVNAGGKRSQKLVLSERELVRMLFGQGALQQMWQASKEMESLAHALPLKLFVPPLNHI